MEGIPIYNAYIPEPLETKFYRFEPVQNFQEKYEKWEETTKYSRDINLLSAHAHELLPKEDIPQSFFYASQPKIWDYCMMLGFFQNRNVFPLKREEETLFSRRGQTYDWPLLTFEEVKIHLESAVQKLDTMVSKERAVILRTLLLLFEGEFFTKYNDLRDVWYLQALELFVRGTYCIDKNITDPRQAKINGNKITFVQYLRYPVDKFGYDAEYANRNQIDPFLEQIKDVRNWVMHGKVWENTLYKTRAEEYMFFIRVTSLLKAFVLSYLDINSFRNRDAMIHGQAYGNHIITTWVND